MYETFPPWDLVYNHCFLQLNLFVLSCRLFNQAFYMKSNEETIPAHIDTEIVRWYLTSELETLIKLEKNQTILLSNLTERLKYVIKNSALREGIEEITRIAATKKMITKPLRDRLIGYKDILQPVNPFEFNGLSIFEEVVQYIQHQLSNLDTQKEIDETIVECAYHAHELAKKTKVCQSQAMEEHPFEPILQDSTVKPVASSTPSLAASPCIPVSLQKTSPDSAPSSTKKEFTGFRPPTPGWRNPRSQQPQQPRDTVEKTIVFSGDGRPPRPVTKIPSLVVPPKTESHAQDAQQSTLKMTSFLDKEHNKGLKFKDKTVVSSALNVKATEFIPSLFKKTALIQFSAKNGKK